MLEKKYYYPNDMNILQQQFDDIGYTVEVYTWSKNRKDIINYKYTVDYLIIEIHLKDISRQGSHATREFAVKAFRLNKRYNSNKVSKYLNSVLDKLCNNKYKGHISSSLCDKISLFFNFIELFNYLYPKEAYIIDITGGALVIILFIVFIVICRNSHSLYLSSIFTYDKSDLESTLFAVIAGILIVGIIMAVNIKKDKKK